MIAGAAPIMEGRFYDCDLRSLLEIVSVGRQHIVIDVRSETGLELGMIGLKSGQIVSAKAGPTTDLQAILKLSNVAKEARFQVIPQSGNSLHGVTKPVAAIADVLAELARIVSPESAPAPRDERIWVMSGSFAEVDLASVMQVVSLSRQLAGIEITDADGYHCGTVLIKASRVLSVTCGKANGLRALAKLLSLSDTHTFGVYRVTFRDDYGDGLGQLSAILLASAALSPDDASAEQAEGKHDTVRPPQGAPPPAPVAAVAARAPVNGVAKLAFAKAVPPPPMRAQAGPKLDPNKEQKLSAILKALCETSQDTGGAAVITREGFLVSSLRLDGKAEAVAAVSASLVAPAVRAVHDLMHGELEQLWVRASSGSILLSRINDQSALIVLTNDEARFGLVLLEMRRAVRELATLVS